VPAQVHLDELARVNPAIQADERLLRQHGVRIAALHGYRRQNDKRLHAQDAPLVRLRHGERRLAGHGDIDLAVHDFRIEPCRVVAKDAHLDPRMRLHERNEHVRKHARERRLHYAEPKLARKLAARGDRLHVPHLSEHRSSPVED